MSSLEKLVDWFIGVPWYQVLVVVIGPLSALLAVLISEYFKVRGREALFSEEIFKRKIVIYENLFRVMWDAYEKNSELISTNALSSEQSEEQRKKVWSPTILGVAAYLDENKLYISEELTIHCISSLIGGEDLPVMNEEEKKDFYLNRSRTIDLIKEESGLKRLDNFLGKINNVKLKSGYIEMYQRFKKEHPTELN